MDLRFEIQRRLKRNNWTWNHLCWRIQVCREDLDKVLSESPQIPPKLALALSRELGETVGFWMGKLR